MMNKRTRAIGVATAAVSAGIIAATVGLAGADESSTPAQKLASMKNAYPSLQDAAPGAPAPMDQKATASSTLRTADGREVKLTATDSQQFCVEVNGASSCEPGASVAEHGKFLAEVDCAASVAKLTGVVPRGVTRVTARGTGVSSVVPVNGVVTMEVPGVTFTGLLLDSGKVHPLALDGKSLCATK